MGTEAPRTDPLDRQTAIRLTERDVVEFSNAARAEDRTLAAWLRRQGRLAVERQREAQQQEGPR
jgi:hypothetical protein